MLPLNVILQQSLIVGLAMSAVMTVLIMISLKINPEMWLQDYPPDVKAVWGPMSEKAKRQRTVFILPFFGALIAGIVWAVVGLGEAGFLSVFLTITLVMLIFNLVDAVIIDWLFLTVLWPNFAVLPGTEGMAGYRDMKLWTINLLKGVVFAAAAGLIVAGIASGIGLVAQLI